MQRRRPWRPTPPATPAPSRLASGVTRHESRRRRQKSAARSRDRKRCKSTPRYGEAWSPTLRSPATTPRSPGTTLRSSAPASHGHPGARYPPHRPAPHVQHCNARNLCHATPDPWRRGAGNRDPTPGRFRIRGAEEAGFNVNAGWYRNGAQINRNSARFDRVVGGESRRRQAAPMRRGRNWNEENLFNSPRQSDNFPADDPAFPPSGGAPGVVIDYDDDPYDDAAEREADAHDFDKYHHEKSSASSSSSSSSSSSGYSSSYGSSSSSSSSKTQDSKKFNRELPLERDLTCYSPGCGEEDRWFPTEKTSALWFVVCVAAWTIYALAIDDEPPCVNCGWRSPFW